MSVRVKDIMAFMEEIAPKKLAEDWDNTGLAVGDPDAAVRRVLLALAVIDPVIEEAIAYNADLILTHHPMLLFQKINAITKDTPLGNRIFNLISHQIAAFSAHTNLDVVQGGTNDVLAELAGLQNIEILEQTYAEPLKKLVVYVPLSHVDFLRTALHEAGAGHIGSYAGCSFAAEGIGTFLPLAGTNPYIGQAGQMEHVAEARLETIVPAHLLQTVIEKMKQAHPYEEVAFDIYSVAQTGKPEGIGRIGNLEQEMTFEAFAARLKACLNLDGLRLVGNPQQRVKRVGLCTGSGVEFMQIAKKQGADVYLTGDIKYHEAQKAVEMGLCVVDVTHYASEVLILPVLEKLLKEQSATCGWEIEVACSKVNGQTFWTI